ncbi:hypothetical protein ACFVT2_35930 [Streptomyces sp. NPDC058000]|uniref:hypothetical protein n=1 Tax=Streptomyces sp. NPDC058000 TaxID=3346299 RepID=UPI0036ECAF13
MRGRHRHDDPPLEVWLGRLWLLGSTAALALLAVLTVQHDSNHVPPAPTTAPDTNPVP